MKICLKSTVILSRDHTYVVADITIELAASLCIFPMKAAGSPETSVSICQAVRHCSSEYPVFNIYRNKNLKEDIDIHGRY